jgi:hypothetical protein
MRDLESAQHAAMEELVWRQPGDVLAVEHDLAAIGRDVSRYEIEKRGFSGPIRADESGDRTAFDPERAVVDSPQAAKALGDALNVNDCVEGQ